MCAERRTRMPIALVMLLAFALLINYVDRGSIGIAAPLIQKEFNLSPSEIGWVLSAFFWAYVALQPVAGWLADRLGATLVLTVGFCVWAIATALTGIAGGFIALVACRLLMGSGESVAYPSVTKLLATHVETRHRVRATGTAMLGPIAGAAFGAFFGGLLMVHYGWRAMLIGLGVGSLLWLVPWLVWTRRHSESARASEAAGGPSTIAILKERALWGGMLGIFCVNYAFYFVFTWAPLYLVQERGLSLTTMTQVTGSIYLVDGASILLSAWLIDKWVARGASLNKAYKTSLALAGAGVGICLVASAGVGPTGAVVALLVMGAMDGMNGGMIGVVSQTFAGPSAAGRWVGIQNAVGNVAGMVAPVATGYLVQQTGNYTAALLVSGGAALVGVIAWVVVTPAVRPIEWIVNDPSTYGVKHPLRDARPV